MEVELILDRLLKETGASRVTLRQDLPGQNLPVTHEVCAPGVPSIREIEMPNMSRQPLMLEVKQGRQVVHDDCQAAFPDPLFQDMLELYGRMRAQIVTPVLVEGRLAAILSLHQLGSTRRWTRREIELCGAVAAEVGKLL